MFAGNSSGVCHEILSGKATVRTSDERVTAERNCRRAVSYDVTGRGASHDAGQALSPLWTPVRTFGLVLSNQVISSQPDCSLDDSSFLLSVLAIVIGRFRPDQARFRYPDSTIPHSPVSLMIRPDRCGSRSATHQHPSALTAADGWLAEGTGTKDHVEQVHAPRKVRGHSRARAFPRPRSRASQNVLLAFCTATCNSAIPHPVSSPNDIPSPFTAIAPFSLPPSPLH